MTTNELRFTPIKCPVCNGYTTIGYKKDPCLACDQKGFIIIDQETGLQINDNDDNKKEISQKG